MIDLSKLHASQINAASEYPFGEFSGRRGIVTSIYEKEFASGWVLLSELEHLKCDLPIEIWYKNGELSSKHLELIKTLSLDLTLNILEDDVSSWAIKPFAVYRSSFEEVLWLDSDNVPLRNPSFLFDDPEYISKGSLFWRDVSGADRSKFWHQGSPVWQVFNVPYNDSEEFDAGQFLINKNKCREELALVLHFNHHSDIYWKYVHGDKDTFRLAWQNIAERTRGTKRHNYLENPNDVPYGFMPYGPFHVGPPNPWGKWGGGSIMQQRDRQGNPLFNHRTIFKFGFADNIISTEHDERYIEYIEIAKDFLEILTD